MTIAAGTRLGPYEILALLGAGGMGEVYRARDARVGREVAVKILPAEIASDPLRRRRFEQEARLAASLNHPNIVGLFDVGIAHDPPYLVSELVVGESLRAVLSRGAIPLRKVLDLGAQIAEGLAAAHATGVVHRDIKPENVMVTPEGRAKILDFGLARVEEGRGPDAAGSPTVTAAWETPGATLPGTVVGTVSYMSPEQASGQGVDYRSDQFSLGLVLYEMLARRRAFDRRTTAQTMAAIIGDEPRPLPTTLPTQVRWAMERCLAKDPAGRYASTGDLAIELGNLRQRSSGFTSLSERPTAARRARPVSTWTGITAAVLLLVFALSLRALIVETPTVNLARYRISPFATMLRESREPTWSRDGTLIAFLGWVDAEAGFQIFVRDVKGSTAVQITHAPFEPEGDLAWSPDARMLYCAGSLETRPGVTQAGVFRIPAAGGAPVLVQASDPRLGIIREAALSPDGTALVMVAQGGPGQPSRVYYASPPEGHRKLYDPGVPADENTVDPGPIAFSPDGARVLVYLKGKSWILPWPPGSGRPIRELTDVFGAVSWMPDSRHLLRSSSVSLYMVDTHTGRQWCVFRSSGVTRCDGPAVSPDGRQIAYVAAVPNADIIEMPLDGRAPRTLVGTRGWEDAPALSVDGRELVYRTMGGLYSKDLRGGAVRPMVNWEDVVDDSAKRPMLLYAPVLSPDRRRLAFEAWYGERVRVMIAFTAGGVPVRATVEEKDPVERSPAWSPDGRRLAYIRHGEPMSLEVVRPGTTDRPLRIWEGQTWLPPAWSPTGEWIAVADTSRVLLVSPDGRRFRALNVRRGPLAWAPDGRALFVIHIDPGVPPKPGFVSVVDIDTGRERVVVRELGEHTPNFLGPQMRVTVTPDGRSLVYTVPRSGSDIFMLEGVMTPRPWYERLWPL